MPPPYPLTAPRPGVRGVVAALDSMTKMQESIRLLGTIVRQTEFDGGRLGILSPDQLRSLHHREKVQASLFTLGGCKTHHSWTLPSGADAAPAPNFE